MSTEIGLKHSKTVHTLSNRVTPTEFQAIVTIWECRPNMAAFSDFSKEDSLFIYLWG
jgi:hypothetical protein